MSLEKAHGGVYSSLAEGLQSPLSNLVFSEMGILDEIQKAGILVSITTGLEALSRGNENDRINYWLSDLANAGQLPEEPRQRMKWDEFMKVTAAGRDVDFTKFILTEDEAISAQQQAASFQSGLDANVKQAGQAPGQAPQAQQY